jgi:hypothetical protein
MRRIFGVSLAISVLCLSLGTSDLFAQWDGLNGTGDGNRRTQSGTGDGGPRPITQDQRGKVDRLTGALDRYTTAQQNRSFAFNESGRQAAQKEMDSALQSFTALRKNGNLLFLSVEQALDGYSKASSDKQFAFNEASKFVPGLKMDAAKEDIERLLPETRVSITTAWEKYAQARRDIGFAFNDAARDVATFKKETYWKMYQAAVARNERFYKSGQTAWDEYLKALDSERFAFSDTDKALARLRAAELRREIINHWADDAPYVGNIKNKHLHRRGDGSTLPAPDNRECFWTLEAAQRAGYSLPSTGTGDGRPKGTGSGTGNGSSKGTGNGGPAPYIGNKNSHKLHHANDGHLPAPQNQVPFWSLDDARRAGYDF